MRRDYGKPGATSRFAGSPRAATSAATIDAANAGFGTNEGDNEITGLHRLGRRPGVGRDPRRQDARSFGNGGWRWFYTQQHGDNFTYEVLPKSSGN